MPTIRRALFTRPSHEASLLPIYAALILLAVLSLIGFAAAFWPRDSVLARTAPPAVEASAAPPQRAHEAEIRRRAPSPWKSM